MYISIWFLNLIRLLMAKSIINYIKMKKKNSKQQLTKFKEIGKNLKKRELQKNF